MDTHVHTANDQITTPDHPQLAALRERLSALAGDLDCTGDWPQEQLRLCGEYGVFRWFLAPGSGGVGWSDDDVIRGYLALSAACLTTTFIITQRTGACRRIEGSDNQPLKDQLLPHLASGPSFATVGVSHLTTSRRHVATPVLRAEEASDRFVLNGYSPWVTGAKHAQTVVTGATLEDGRQILVALPMDRPGVTVPAPAALVGLSASHTGPVELKDVEIERDLLLAGPMENVMATGQGAGTGGLQTSTLAVGLTAAAIEYLRDETTRRENLNTPVDALEAEYARVRDDLLCLAAGREVCSNEQLRQRANSLVLRTSQAALAAAKGTGYVVGHPAGRFCREALFFLVWSCPQPVMQANLCELAGITS